MCKLSIITINRNNAIGLKKTMESVFSQTDRDFEYVVVDGASNDKSIDVIKSFEDSKRNHFHWISEPDSGIYNAMNKGIKMAKGEYVQFLNSGDCLASPDVTEQMLLQLSTFHFPLSVLYGNMIKQMPKGLLRDRGFSGRQPTMLDFYRGTLNHSPAYIRRDLFDKYGLYDENLKIVSDWKWYLQVIIKGGEHIEYTNIDVTLFDMNGISEVNKELDRAERRQVLEVFLPRAILVNYDQWSFPINQMERIKRYLWADKLFCFSERILFKWEKWRGRKTI